MLIYLFVLGAWMVYVTRDGMGGGDLSSTQTDELFWSKVIQIRGVFHILSKISETMHCFVSNLGGKPSLEHLPPDCVVFIRTKTLNLIMKGE